MIKSVLMGVFATLLFSGVAFGDDQDDVEAVLEAYSAALESEDVMAAEARVRTDGEDFTIFEGAGRNIGWSDYRDHHLVPEFAAEGFAIHEYDWRDYRIDVSGDMALATFSIHMEYTVHGEDRERDANGTAVLLRTADGWLIRHMHTS